MDNTLQLSEDHTVERFNRSQDRVARDFGYGQTAGALGITKDALKPLRDLIQQRIDTVATLPALSSDKAFWMAVRPLGADLIAFAALDACLNSVAVGDNGLVSRLKIGQAIAGEAFAAGLLENDGLLAKRIDRAVRRKHGNLQYRKQAARSIAARSGYRDQTWTKEVKLKAGAILFSVVLEALPDIFKFDVVKDIPGYGYLSITDGALALAENAVEQALRRHPVRLPLTERPKPWTGFAEGPYSDSVRLNTTVIRSNHKETAGAIRAAIKAGAMQPFMGALNSLQNVAWTINQPVLEVLKWAYETGVQVEGLPPKADVPLPPRVENWDRMSDDAKRLWKHKRNKIKERNRSYISNRVLLAHDLQTADLMAEAGRFWTPMNCDWRGRVYPIPHFNFQRDDRVRALFLFAEGQPIGEEGLRWLKIHIANCGDFDKISKRPLEERVQWTDDNLSKLLKCAGTPKALPNLQFWTQADQPFLFLAACMELAAALAAGPAFMTRLPVSFDGSCSGLQHLAAITRDEETGQLVNLTPGTIPQDVYQAVATLVTNRLKVDADTTGVTANLAKICLAYGISRSLVKRNVMTYSYSSKKFGMSQQLMEDLMRPLVFDVLAGKIAEHPFASPEDWVENKKTKKLEKRDDGTAAAKYLAGHIYAAIETLVHRPAEAMDMLQKTARLLAHEGKPVTWTTPLGLPWINRYHEPDLRRISLWLRDTRIQMVYADGFKKDIDKEKAANGVAPNFVHALDATHLLMVARACACEDITQVATVHDSFGCLAPQATRFNQIIREQFVELYEKHDVLREVLDQASHDLTLHNQQRLPSVPRYGSLNLKGVLDADFAFA